MDRTVAIIISDIVEFNKKSECLNSVNESAISVIKNINFYKKWKYIDIKFHFIKEKYYDKIIELNYCAVMNNMLTVLLNLSVKLNFVFKKIKLELNSDVCF